MESSEQIAGDLGPLLSEVIELAQQVADREGMDPGARDQRAAEALLQAASPVLYAKRVREIFLDCLSQDDGVQDDPVVVDGMMRTARFYPSRLTRHRDEIGAMLLELPGPFMATKGGGWSSLNACMDKGGRQWGEQSDVDWLFMLGVGAGLAQCQLPREIWPALPGGMPYYVVLDGEVT